VASIKQAPLLLLAQLDGYPNAVSGGLGPFLVIALEQLHCTLHGNGAVVGRTPHPDYVLERVLLGGFGKFPLLGLLSSKSP
jgi:hypothetical protein